MSCVVPCQSRLTYDGSPIATLHLPLPFGLPLNHRPVFLG
jgi:hypothetical protein